MSQGRKLFVYSLLIAFCSLLVMMPVQAQEEQTVHIVQRGENLYRIALRYGVSMEAIAQANGLVNQARILAGQELIIPNFDPTPTVVENPMLAAEPSIHVVAPGETLASIARLYGVTPEQLAQSNNITNMNLIRRGDELKVWSLIPSENEVITTDANTLPPVETAPIEVITAPEQVVSASSTHVVQPGEHLAQIARNYGLNWTDVAQANNLSNPNHIFAGQSLVIPGVSFAGGVQAAPVYTYAPPLARVGLGKEIIVDLSDSRIYAYENGALLNNVLASTGLPATPTVQGTYSIYWKLGAQTMSGPGYYLPDVPYVMYFYQGYAIHGTYWHNNFGQPMSHGCVNLPTPDSEWFFNWAEVGTPVHVQV